MPRWIWAVGLALLLLAGVVLVLGWVSSGFRGVEGWIGYLGGAAVGAAILWAGWWVLRSEDLPAWLGGLLVLTTLLRLGLGVFWFVALPELGYDSPAELKGYVMADAFKRDQAAIELALSEKPLLRAFQGYRGADQYGGMLFLSALIYRYLGGGIPIAARPLLMVWIVACFSSLAVLYTWSFSRRAWGAPVANLAACGLALYPEAVLLGSSQMREAFTISLVATAFYGLLRYGQERSWQGLALVLGALLFSLLFSPPMAAMLLVMLALAAMTFGFRVGLEGKRVFYQPRFWVILSFLALLAFAGVWLTWGHFAPQGMSNPLELVSWWIRKSFDWQAHLSEQASGWLQKIFRNSPPWLNLPFLLGYGVLRPFLPAALADVTAVPVWRWVAIWRAAGWTLLLPFLVYAPLRAFRRVDRQNPQDINPRMLSLIVWLGILAASFRSGGDQWDNPRYRAMFACLQISLAAWVWVSRRRLSDPWLRRVLIGMGCLLAWFMPWYLLRYLHFAWPVGDLFKTIGLGVLSTVLVWLWDWARMAERRDE